VASGLSLFASELRPLWSHTLNYILMIVYNYYKYIYCNETRTRSWSLDVVWLPPPANEWITSTAQVGDSN